MGGFPVVTRMVRGAVNEREPAKSPESSLPGDREKTTNSRDVTDARTARSLKHVAGREKRRRWGWEKS